jgi:hypothetical protein
VSIELCSTQSSESMDVPCRDISCSLLEPGSL